MMTKVLYITMYSRWFGVALAAAAVYVLWGNAGVVVRVWWKHGPAVVHLEFLSEVPRAVRKRGIGLIFISRKYI